MEEIKFTDDEKIKMFDKIAEHFYNRNFGSFAKTDMELLMFCFYVEKLTSKATDDKGIINYNVCSDYIISKELGITQQRVHNLKVKKELVYPTLPHESWKEEFANLVENARYDEKTGKFSLKIPDPNLFLEIQHYLEENGGYVDKTLSSDLLNIRAEYFIDLIISLSDDVSREDIIKQLKTSIVKNGGDERSLDEKHIGENLLNGVVNLSEIILNLSSLVLPENAFGRALRFIFKHLCDCN